MCDLMPRFYFNLCNGAEFIEDEEGVELADRVAARAKAVESLRGVMAGDLVMGDLNTASFIEIEDEQHILIETVFFADVVNLRRDPDARPRAKRSGEHSSALQRNGTDRS